MWTPAQEEAYQKLQAMVTSPPVLAFYSSDAATRVSADASSYGIGAVLLQIQRDGRKAPVAYVSRALTPTEQRYSQIEKEALAMAWACEKFECYLLGQPTPFLVETDHKPLLTIMNMQHLDQRPPRLQCLKMRMMRYLFHVIYVPGNEITIGDTLSRSLVDKSDVTLGAAIEEHVDSITSVWPVSGFMQNKLRKETSRDPQLSRLLKILQTHWPKAMHQLDVDLRQFWNARHLLTEVNGIVLRGSQIVIPKSLRRDMIQSAHEGHLGIAKTKCRAREVIWWPGMGAQLETVVANCNVCARYRREQRREPLQVSTLLERPWQRVAADLFQLCDVHYLLVVN